MNPEIRFRNGRVSAAVWANERTVKGEDRVIRSITLQKRYTDSNGTWKTTNSFNVREIPQAMSVLQEAFNYLTLKTVETETTPS